jgi:hypothetical protein
MCTLFHDFALIPIIARIKTNAKNASLKGP